VAGRSPPPVDRTAIPGQSPRARDWREASSRVPIAAMANGIPVRASDGGALPETLGDAGFICAISERANRPAASRQPHRRWLLGSRSSNPCGMTWNSRLSTGEGPSPRCSDGISSEWWTRMSGASVREMDLSWRRPMVGEYPLARPGPGHEDFAVATQSELAGARAVSCSARESRVKPDTFGRTCGSGLVEIGSGGCIECSTVTQKLNAGKGLC
jgi:hypothetical protein